MKNWLPLLAGALAGGLIGYFAFLWIARQGFYALVLPGALVGIGASLAPNRSLAMCVVCGVLALALGLEVCAFHQGRQPGVFCRPHSPAQADHVYHDRSRHMHRLLGAV